MAHLMSNMEKISNDHTNQSLALQMFAQLKGMSSGDRMLMTESFIPNLEGSIELHCTKNDMETIEADVKFYGITVNKIKVKERNGRIEMAIVRE